jgi:hypothetical protein
MPVVNPQHYATIVEGVMKRDGTRGYLVRKHWIVTAWWLLACAGAGAYCGIILTLGHRTTALTTTMLLVLALWFWWWVNTRTFLLVTRKAVYYQYVSKFERETRRIGYGGSFTVRFKNEGANIVRAKTVIVTTGDQDDITFPRAGGGDEMTRAVNTLTGTPS